MAEKIALGDVVKLNSGGEAMTVEEIDGEDVSCVWFEGKRVQRGTFGAAVLTKYVRPPIGAAIVRG
jgi:uncharacterized protein YodC (DUF2158 family)